MNKLIIFIGFLCLSVSAFAVSLNVKQTFGPTVACDDLWQIANQLHDGNEVTVQQIMLAILKKNPSAFYQENVNGLLKDVKLFVPSMSEVKQVPVKTAEMTVKHQNVLWKDVIDDLSKKHSKTYLALRHQCCSTGHIKHLSDRFHKISKVSSSQQSKPSYQNRTQQETFQVAQIEGNVNTPVVDLENKITELTKENQDLQSQLDHLKIEKAILQQDNLLQWIIIDTLQHQKKVRTLLPSKHHFSMNHDIKNFLVRSLQSGREIITTQRETFRQLGSKWLNRFISADPILIGTMGSLIFFVIVLLWALPRCKKQQVHRQQSVSSSAVEEEIPLQEEIESEDIMATKLDLARVYIDMGEHSRARSILKNVLQNGDKAQQLEAQTLLKELARQ